LKFEPDAEIGQISADFERGRFAKVSRCCGYFFQFPQLGKILPLLTKGQGPNTYCPHIAFYPRK
jgi:hypothetical protein